ncbi:serine hydrolase domain-containing protein [Spirosoma validum]|uniref:Beta-lactamase family protein n=1 Tax=Spirosoma validum TaxID=2771355 RepID=A0A927GF49_9BACT|nr:serine hydrolase domain-containing protein [Spirosoma validum]MBD2755275.1 beta-lactamase family protein [Spirosoma validum]
MKTPFIDIVAASLALAITLPGYQEGEQGRGPIPNESASRQVSTDVGFSKIGRFDPLMLKTEIDKFLSNHNLAGYAYAIFVDGQWVEAAGGQGGHIRKGIDAPAAPHSPLARQEIASCSKYITTLAMVRMLDRAGLPLDTTIGAYLPAYMNAIASVRAITFRQLLAHHSGLVGGMNDINITLAKMQQCVQTSNSAQFNTYQYNNMNLALCRLLLPYVYWKEVMKLTPQTLAESEINPSLLDNQLATLFLSFVRTDVFKAAGLSTWEELGATDPGTTRPTLYYDTNLEGAAGVTVPPLSTILNLGQGGFDLNAVELAQIASAANDNKIVSKSLMKAIRTGYKNRPLGFNDFRSGAYGRYYFKYGNINWNVNGRRGGVATLLVDFDCSQAHVQVAILSNDDEPDITNINWLQEAFDKSW